MGFTLVFILLSNISIIISNFTSTLTDMKNNTELTTKLTNDDNWSNTNILTSTLDTHINVNQEEETIKNILRYTNTGITAFSFLLIIIILAIICMRRSPRKKSVYRPHFKESYILKTRTKPYSCEKSTMTNMIQNNGSVKHTGVDIKPELPRLPSSNQGQQTNPEDDDYVNQDLVSNRHTIYSDHDLEIIDNDLYISADFFNKLNP